jgi:branched-chain amino acid transport system ATP-binding protein
MTLLAVRDLHAYFGASHVLQGVSLALEPGRVVTLLGRNGAGKTTTLKAIMGILAPARGEVRVDGVDLAGAAPHALARAGLGYVPETRAVFPSLTVEENLTLAARGEGWNLERVYALFPRLAERRRAGGGRLSGGEQQMLAIARALLTNPRVLLLDEPTEGLAPVIVDEIERVLVRLGESEGLAILLVEQKLDFALAFADEVVVLGKGRVRWSGSAASFAAETSVQRDWLGL